MNLISVTTARRERGVALVIVLAMLVLLSALMVSFMSTATSERSAVSAASGGSAARQLADTTVNLMIGQIREATSQSDLSGTWASQPGAIRTYTGALSKTKKNLPGGGYYYDYKAGTQDKVYKLYSASKMKVTSSEYEGSELPEEVKVIENWKRDDPEKDFVDLNEPALTPRFDLDPEGTQVEPHYPIVDPRAKFDAKGNVNKSSEPGIVDGFDAKIVTDDKLKTPNGQDVPYVPMPVQWLYVMRDGSVGPASDGTPTNPIVGRTAFWTDDETCKLNINTASEGTFWDTPSSSNVQEAGKLLSPTAANIQQNATSLALAASQPARGEYQRYSGHPATTSLSPVLGWLWGITPTTKIYPNVAPYVAYKEAIYKIAPFLPYGKPTSEGATKNTWSYLRNTTGAPDVVVDTKHLYANVDELLFKPARIEELNDKLTPEALEKTRFFLTATSRAPELNLFGRPRVTLWPIHSEFASRSTYDDLFAFTSTIAKTPGTDEKEDKRYYLTRYDAKDDRNDFLLPKSTGGKSQNQLMYEYLQFVTGGGSIGQGAPEVPGFGGKFRTKYSYQAKGSPGTIERDQILTEIFDYTRTVNLVDTGTISRTGKKFVPYTPPFFPASQAGSDDYQRTHRSIDWSAQVTPIKISPAAGAQDTQGLGRFVTVAEAALVFHRSEKGKVSALLLLEMVTPMPGYPALRDTYWTVVKEDKDKKSAIVVAGTESPLNFPSGELNKPFRDGGGGGINIVNVGSHEIGMGRAFMPTMGFINPLVYFPEHKGPTDLTPSDRPDQDPNRTSAMTLLAKKMDKTGAGSYQKNTTVTKYPYISDAIAAPDTGTFDLKGGNFEVEIWTGNSPDDKRSCLVQTIQFSFPDASKLPLPTANAAPIPGRLTSLNAPDDSRNLIKEGDDTVRGVELTCGGKALGNKADIRIAMTRKLIKLEDKFFEPVSGYTSTARHAHNLTRAWGAPEIGNTGSRGVLVAGSQLRDKAPLLPKGVTSGVLRADGGPGDWDRGLSKHLDGAFGNKVDEGNLEFDPGDSGIGVLPYFRGRNVKETGQSFFTPNRQLPSPVMLGSLPTGALEGLGWQTLLFRPDREAGNSHPGAKQFPLDHLWLDLFHIPIVEPYAISEPFSTAGKVNMNYVIAPFGYAKGDGGNNARTGNPRSYLRRDSGLRGVMKSTFITAIPTNLANSGHAEDGYTETRETRHPIDLDKTLEAFEVRLNDQKQGISSRGMTLFRSASEICEMDLFPQGITVSNWNNFWNGSSGSSYGLTGDNQRERPYAHIYPRLTTKSNVFTVHMRCQAIRKSPGSDPDKFDEDKDVIAGEYRGSATIERFLDPNDEALRDYDHEKDSADRYYRYRVVSTKQFNPK